MAESLDDANTKSPPPLVSFLLMAYNQARSIESAIAGALQQTYTPLEIVLSDDASSDETFSLMQEMAAAYRGPHRIVLNRNPTNLGVGAHFNQLVSLSSGELMFVAAGDDISLPDRCRLAVESWRARDCQADLIATALIDMDEAGQDHGRINPDQLGPYRNAADWFAKPPYVVGAAHAWSRRLFDRFGPLPDDLVAEDQVMVFRAIMSGGAITLNHALVRYRRGGLSSRQSGATAADVARRLQRHSRHAQAELLQLLADARVAQQIDAVKGPLESRLARERFIREIFACENRFDQFKLALFAKRVSVPNRLRIFVYAAIPGLLAPFFFAKRQIRGR